MGSELVFHLNRKFCLNRLQKPLLSNSRFFTCNHRLTPVLSNSAFVIAVLSLLDTRGALLFLGTFLIALREGVEAALLVGILVGFIVKLDRRDLLWKVWTAVILAAGIPLALGAYMTWGPYTLSFQSQEIIGGGLSLVAVAFVTWMIFWMAHHSREFSKSITHEAQIALNKQSSWGIVGLAALTVGREGIETAVFVWATVRSSATQGIADPALGVLAGLAVAIAIGVAVYAGSRAINLRLFFMITGYLLIFVAAGIVMYGIGDLQEASLIPGWGTLAYDATGLIQGAAGAWWFVLLNAFFNVQYLFGPTHVQLIGWILYLVITFALYTRTLKPSQNTPSSVKEASSKTPKTPLADDSHPTEQQRELSAEQ